MAENRPCYFSTWQGKRQEGGCKETKASVQGFKFKLSFESAHARHTESELSSALAY